MRAVHFYGCPTGYHRQRHMKCSEKLLRPKASLCALTPGLCLVILRGGGVKLAPRDFG